MDLILGFVGTIIKAGFEAATMSETQALAHLGTTLLETGTACLEMHTKITTARAAQDAALAAKFPKDE